MGSKCHERVAKVLSRQLILTFSSCDFSFLWSNVFFSFLEKVIKFPRKSINNIIRKYYNQENNFLCHFFVHPPSHLSKSVKVVSSIQLSLKCEIFQKKSVSKNVIGSILVRSQMQLLKYVLKGNPVYFCLFCGEKPLYSDVIHTNGHKQI